MSTQDGVALVPWERCSSVVAAKRQALAACLYRWNVLFKAQRMASMPDRLVLMLEELPRLSHLLPWAFPPPRPGPGWWERARGQAWVSSCHLATGGLEESFNKPSVINAETIALKAHRWISRLARGFNVSSPKPSDTLTSLYIIPKKLTASCN